MNMSMKNPAIMAFARRRAGVSWGHEVSMRRFARPVIALLFALSLALSVAGPALAEKPAYFSALSDLPVAPSLREEPGSAVRFDQPEGRIIVLQAVGTAEPSDIMEFYAKTLPALGWTLKAPGQYVRDREVLLLDVKPGPDGNNRLRLLLRPR